MFHARPDLLPSLSHWRERWHAGDLEAAPFAALYFFTWQIARHGRAYAARKHKLDPGPDGDPGINRWAQLSGAALQESLLDKLMRYQFRGVRAAVPLALRAWLRGEWALTLREEVPSAETVLQLQALGQRPVTVIVDYPRLLDPVLTKPDAFAFFLHDLEHACKFFAMPALHAAQRAFFGQLQRAVVDGVFIGYFADTEFVKKFHYLMSDMNTHPEHSRQYLRAILIEAELRRAGLRPTEPLSRTAQQAVAGALRAVQPAATWAECA